MTAVANQFGYWQTGNFNNGSFTAPDQQASISIDRSTGREGYGYQFYTQGRWGRTDWNSWAWNRPSCWYAREITPAPANSIQIVNNANTTVTHLGSGVYRIEKTSGAADYDADAISVAGAAGDFVLRLQPYTAGIGLSYGGGVSASPAGSSHYLGVDNFIFVSTVYNWGIYEGGSSTGVSGATGAAYYWIWRSGGTTLGYGRGPDLATAQASPDRTTTKSGTVYFDSSFYGVGDVLEASFANVPTSYSLAAASGAYTIAGVPAALKADRKLIAAVGTYNYTGTATGLAKGYKLAAAVGAYSVTGVATALRIARKQVEAVGSYAITGTLTALRAARRLAANVGSYAISGTATGLRKGYNQAEAVGAYSISGVATVLRIARRQVEAVGSYAITGTATDLRVTLPVPVGSYTISGQSVTLTYGAASKVLTAAVGSYSLSGVSTALRASRRLTGAIGSYAYTGTTTGLRVARRLAAAPGAYSIVGIGPVLGTVLPLTSGSYALSGVSVNLRRAARLPVLVGAYALTGLAAFLSATRRLGVSQGAYVITGTAALLRISKGLAAVPGSYVLTGYDADLRTNDVILRLNVGSYVLTGTALGFIKTVAVPASRIVAPSSVSRLVEPPTRELVAQAERVGRVVSPSRRLA